MNVNGIPPILLLPILIPLLALAVYRVTRFWIKDTLIANTRIWVLNRTMLSKKNTTNAVRGKLHELLECHYCVSGQLSWIAVVVTMQWVSIPLPVLVWLAVWGIEPLLWRWSEDIIDVRVQVPYAIKHREQKYGE